MTYEEFKADYLNCYRQMMRYNPGEVGAGLWAEKMSSLSGKFPDWADKVEDENG